MITQRIFRKATHGFILYERIDGDRVRHFRKSTATMYFIAVARVHDLVRSQKWADKRVFEIWDGITPISLITCTKDNGRINYADRDYLLQPSDKREALGYEADYQEATAYKRKITCGPRTGDLTSWIKKAPLDRVLCTIVDKESFVMGKKFTERSLRK